MIGLKQGIVKLEDHKEEWITAAKQTIETLNDLLNEYAVDIQHVGSTSIPLIKAKPIIDLIVGIKSKEAHSGVDRVLVEEGYIKSVKHQVDGDVLYLMRVGDVTSYHIHIVIYGEGVWNDYLRFRDYLLDTPHVAHQYNELKERLAIMNKNNRNAYTKAKSEFIHKALNEACNR